MTPLIRLTKFCCCALAMLLLLATTQAGEPEATVASHKKLSKSLLLDTALAGNRLLAVGERGHIIYSDNGGDSWQQSQVPTTQMLTAVFFISDRQGWAVGHDGLILETHDGGESWLVQRDGLAAQEKLNRADRNRAQARVAELEAALASANEDTAADLRLNLEEAAMDLEDAEHLLLEADFAPPLMDIWFQNDSLGWAVGAFGTLLQTSDGGKNWQSVGQRIENPEGFHYYGITGNSNGQLFIAGETGGMYRSPDGGLRWQQLDSPYDGSWFGVLQQPSTGVLWVFGLRGNIFRSSDFGSTWTPAGNDNTMTIAGATIAKDGTVVMVGSVGTVLRSNDGGMNFAALMQPNRLSLSSIVVDSEGNYFAAGQGGIHALDLK
jgi:photosystem II stability/assembly factor-like uncharacterized protein